MKRFLLLILPVFIVAACNQPSKTQKIDDSKILSVTIEPQRYFLEKLVGDMYTVNTIVPPGTSPETYEPSPSMMIDLGKSKIYFMVGSLGFENVWGESLSKNNPDVKIVNSSNGIDLIYGGHDHSSHGSHQDHNESEHSEVSDPHVWSSPKTVSIFVKNMYNELVDQDPENEQFYYNNFIELNKIINNTDSVINSLLNNTKSRSFIIYHPALSYLARDYNLNQYSIEFEGKNPSPSQLRGLVDLAKKENIKIVFIQKGFDTKNAEVIANEIGGKVVAIDPLAYEWDKELIKVAAALANNDDE